MSKPLDILFQDEDLFVINKPAGRLVEGTQESLEAEVQRCIDSRARALHRLDLGTSGVLAFSLRRQHHALFAQLWEHRQVKKIYWALVEGLWGELPKDLEDLDEDGRPMKSRVRVLKEFSSYTWIELDLLTGRRHQARLQCSKRGHPILGDTRYGAAGRAEFSPYFALHARSLGFQHPVSKVPAQFLADPPETWRNFTSKP